MIPLKSLSLVLKRVIDYPDAARTKRKNDFRFSQKRPQNWPSHLESLYDLR